jgi:hypothetical protein
MLASRAAVEQRPLLLQHPPCKAEASHSSWHARTCTPASGAVEESSSAFTAACSSSHSRRLRPRSTCGEQTRGSQPESVLRARQASRFVCHITRTSAFGSLQCGRPACQARSGAAQGLRAGGARRDQDGAARQRRASSSYRHLGPCQNPKAGRWSAPGAAARGWQPANCRQARRRRPRRPPCAPH